jgi:hypothetical protein
VALDESFVLNCVYCEGVGVVLEGAIVVERMEAGE